MLSWASLSWSHPPVLAVQPPLTGPRAPPTSSAARAAGTLPCLSTPPRDGGPVRSRCTDLGSVPWSTPEGVVTEGAPARVAPASPLRCTCVQPASPRASLDRAVVCARGRSLAPRRPVPPGGGPPARGRPRSALRGRSPVASPGRSPGRAARLHRLVTPLPVARRTAADASTASSALRSVRPPPCLLRGQVGRGRERPPPARPEGRATAVSLDRRRRRQGSRTAACFAGGRHRPLRRPRLPSRRGGPLADRAATAVPAP